MERTEYNKIEAVNFSSLKHYLRSEAHFLYNWKTPQTEEDDTPARKLGRASHKLILEEKSFDDTYVVLDESQRPVPDKNYQTKANREWRDAQIDFLKRTGKEIVTKDEYDNLFNMASSVKNNIPASGLLVECDFERVIEWTDAVTGVRCKGIVDFPNKKKRIAGDLKNMEDASPDAFGRFIEKWLTYVQMAFYLDGLSIVDGIDYQGAFIIAVEKTPPYVVQPYYISDSDIELGRTIYRALLEKHKKCVLEGKWGGYEANFEQDSDNCINGVIVSKLPAWAYTKAENNESLQQ